LIKDIADFVNDKKLEGISDVRDESDRDGIRVVIELKKDTKPELVLNNLFQKTKLESTFSGNMVTLINEGKKPECVNLKQILKIFISFRYQVNLKMNL
jgi:DNA gyrase subunit A